MNRYLILVASFVFTFELDAVAANSLTDDVFFGDINGIAIGKFNQKVDTYLFSIPKDTPPTDRGVVWGEIFIFEENNKKHPFVSIFNCGLITGGLGPYNISFSDDDRYLVIESGGESGSVIDVFQVSDLYTGQPRKGWSGTDECIKPMATVGGYLVPVTFHGWKGQIPLVESSVPLNKDSTPVQVEELGEQAKCCEGGTKLYSWDILSNQFSTEEMHQ